MVIKQQQVMSCLGRNRAGNLVTNITMQVARSDKSHLIMGQHFFDNSVNIYNSTNFFHTSWTLQFIYVCVIMC